MLYPAIKRVTDLGLSAWMKLHGHKIAEIGPSHVVFHVPDAEKDREMSELEVAYVNSEATEFDSWLMTLKRTPLTLVDEVDPSTRIVEGMGLAAWMRLKGRWRLVGRPSHVSYAFCVPEYEASLFNNLQIGWANSDLRDFDAAMMAIKNIRISNKPGQSQAQRTRRRT